MVSGGCVGGPGASDTPDTAPGAAGATGGERIECERAHPSGNARHAASAPPCPDCDEARRRATASLVQCVCGAWHGPDDATWPRESGVRLRAGLDLPVGAVPAPRQPLPRIERESDEVARVRRLLTELRPYGPGADEDPAAAPQQGPGASLAPRAGRRAPWDVDAPRGAFTRLPPALDAAVVARIARAPDARARAVLEHLRTRGTLSHGYGALAVGVARAAADPERLASWERDEAGGYDRARVWGARRLEEARAAWEAASVAT